MKKILIAVSFLMSTSAFASAGKVAIIKKNLEVKSAIAAFEKNRSQKCAGIKESNTQFEADGKVTLRVSCNQYDKNGEPQANVYFIKIEGYMYDSFFSLTSVLIVGVE